jgi:hypothetical protein
MFLSRDIEFSSELSFVIYLCGKPLFFEKPISQERNIIFGWNFQDIPRIIRPIVERNSVI